MPAHRAILALLKEHKIDNKKALTADELLKLTRRARNVVHAESIPKPILEQEHVAESVLESIEPVAEEVMEPIAEFIPKHPITIESHETVQEVTQEVTQQVEKEQTVEQVNVSSEVIVDDSKEIKEDKSKKTARKKKTDD